jgi:hypothetical protein
MQKCSNCSRAEQPLDQFVGRFGKPTKTCLTCREKGKKNDNTPARIAAHAELQARKGNEYSQASRARRLEADPEGYREHNNEVSRVWRSENREHSAKWYRTNQNARLDAIKRSAVRRDIEWTLDDEVAKKMLIENCHYCGQLDLSVRVNGIDRMNNEIGYIPENVVTCCKTCNYSKKNLSADDFIKMCKAVASGSSTGKPSGFVTDEEFQATCISVSNFA